MKGGTEMNAHEYGKRLSKIVTGTIGVLAVIAASALGLHEWADSVATKAADSAVTSTTDQSAGTAAEGSDDGASDDGGSNGSSQSIPQNAAPVGPANGQAPHATTNGS
jgi:hypothetical protein